MSALLPVPRAPHVVRLRRRRGRLVQGCDVYIGRKCAQGGWDLPASKWANPFVLGRDGDRRSVIDKYRAWIKHQPELLAALGELRGKVLGCWCKPLPCHGDVLVDLVKTHLQ